MKILESRWEQHFIQESQMLEDKLGRGELAPMASRLKLALENNILEWSTYSQWAQQNYLLPVLKRGLYKDQVITLQKKIATFKGEFAKYDFQKFQMIAIDKWENKIILLGLEPNEALNSLNIEYILVLTPPEIITTLMGEALQDNPITGFSATVPAPPPPTAKSAEVDATELFDLADAGDGDEDTGAGASNDSAEEGEEKLTPLDLPKFDDFELGETAVNFNELLVPQDAAAAKPVKPVEQPATTKPTDTPALTKTSEKPSADTDDNNNFVSSIDNIQYWNKMNQDHSSLSADARKHFDGYAVIKISGQNTELFKMDEELQSEKIDPAVFKFSLGEAFFSNLLKTKTTDSISLKMLGKTILDFNYVCATPLFLGDKAVGFILGFKINAMNEQDEDALYRLLKSA